MEHIGGGHDIVIKKATMIKKNYNDINSVYRIEKGVSADEANWINSSEFIRILNKLLETWKWVLWSGPQGYAPGNGFRESN